MKKLFFLCLVIFVSGCGRNHFVIIPRGDNQFEVYAKSGNKVAALKVAQDAAIERCKKVNKTPIFPNGTAPERTGRNLYEVNAVFKCE